MSEDAPRFQFWISARRAAEIGCTHHARFMGIIPGFFAPSTALWVSRSDLLNPVEDALAWLWATMQHIRGDEPSFMFSVGKEIE
jgi:hypothetical protein